MTYKYISLGRHCDIAFNIEKYIGKEYTNFFDWLRTDFRAVLEILKTKDIETILNKNNINIDKKTYANEGDILLKLKNISQKNLICYFHHDMKNYNYRY